MVFQVLIDGFEHPILVLCRSFFKKILIALSGSFEVVLDNGVEKSTVLLNKPNIGLHIGTGIWRELQNFSSGAVCLVIASDVFDEVDYIRDYNDFLKTK